MSNTNYWEFKMQQKKRGELYLYGSITAYAYDSSSAKGFKQELDALGELSELSIYINSPGGSIVEGSAIFSILNRLKVKKTTYGDGVVGSIASVIMQVGDERVMAENAFMVIHNGWAEAAGDANSLRKVADEIEKMTGEMKKVYINRANGKLSEDELTSMMDNETWLTADECLKYGLCDKIITPKQYSAYISPDTFKMYQHIPQNVKNRINYSIDPEIETLIESSNLLLKNMEVF